MSEESKYLIVICGYEGIEGMFGLFTLSEAVDFVRKLKKSKRFRNKLWIPSYTKPEQVCLRKEGKDKQLVCACDDLPEELRNKETWWY